MRMSLRTGNKRHQSSKEGRRHGTSRRPVSHVTPTMRIPDDVAGEGSDTLLNPPGRRPFTRSVAGITATCTGTRRMLGLSTLTGARTQNDEILIAARCLDR
ncbi:hypothetical protein Acsp02_28870 [Actinoplanes sp. NBRC 103695]|nr:hypothetical protein Acsp02_28870 [Actinoplanes sp. NBRC 103695]